MDSQLDDARKNHSKYRYLVETGELMADIDYTYARSCAPLRSAFLYRERNPSYEAIVQKLYVRTRTAHRIADAVVGLIVVGSLIILTTVMYEIYNSGFQNPLDTILRTCVSLFFLAFCGWGYMQRRYSDAFRSRLYTDSVFFEKAIATDGAVRLFWILREPAETPVSYTVRDYRRITEHIQNEELDISIHDTARLRTSMMQDSVVTTLFSNASIAGNLFASSILDESSRASYDFYSPGNDTVFLQNFTDVFCTNEEFFAYVHTHFKEYFSLVPTSGGGMSKLSFTAIS